MDALFSFFALRPVFTRFGMLVVWWLYVLNVALQAYIGVENNVTALAQRGISVNWNLWAPNLIPLILGVVVQVALVRLFLEVAATILSNARGL